MPEEIDNEDELYFIGQHTEQYNHASRYAADYYRRALALDPQDYRNNVALGTLALNAADWSLAEQCARAALLRAHRLNKTLGMVKPACCSLVLWKDRAMKPMHGITITRLRGAEIVVMRPTGLLRGWQ